MNEPFGSYFKALRRQAGALTLREFCSLYGLDHGYISKMERGKAPPPPTDTKIAALATAVGLKEGTPEWSDFRDRAYAARGEIPPDLAGREEVVGRLPVLFRTLRGEQLPMDQLDELLKLLRDA